MKTTALDAHRFTIRNVLPGFSSIWSARRRIGARPLRRASRLSDAGLMGRLTRELAGIATLEYYGHPSRRMAIAYPRQGIDGLDATRAACREAAAFISGSVSCGNYIFSLAQR